MDTSIRVRRRFTGSPTPAVGETNARFTLSRGMAGVQRAADFDCKISAKGLALVTKRHSQLSRFGLERNAIFVIQPSPVLYPAVLYTKRAGTRLGAQWLLNDKSGVLFTDTHRQSRQHRRCPWKIAFFS